MPFFPDYSDGSASFVHIPTYDTTARMAIDPYGLSRHCVKSEDLHLSEDNFSPDDLYNRDYQLQPVLDESSYCPQASTPKTDSSTAESKRAFASETLSMFWPVSAAQIPSTLIIARYDP